VIILHKHNNLSIFIQFYAILQNKAKIIIVNKAGQYVAVCSNLKPKVR